MATRKKPVPVSLDPKTVVAEIKRQEARKKESRKKLREADSDIAIAARGGRVKAKKTPALAPVAARTPEQNAAALRAAHEDAEALGVPIEQVLEDMGLNPDGSICEKPLQSKRKYVGPMIVLREAAKQYGKAANGQPCCGDDLATLCGQFSREQVVRALIRVLGLESNPYSHLNPGQQSMNLRNKTRGALKNGFIQMSDVEASFKQE